MLALAAALLVAGSAAAADYKAPRTPFGQPDLQGAWNSNFILPMEATPITPKLVVPEAEAKVLAARISADVANFQALKLDPEVAEIAQVTARTGLAIVRGERRTRQVVQPADGMLPFTRAARGQVRFIEGVLRNSAEPPLPDANPEDRPNWERCIVGMGQPPITVLNELNPRQILQTRDAVVILTEYGPDLRVIPFSDKHGPAALKSALGDSIARWEGDTLVIETIRLPAKDTIRPFPVLLVSSSATVIERYTRVSDRELLYQYTVVDPATYTAPWMAEYSVYRQDRPLFEFACHEGNYSLPNILAGARQREKAAAAR
jgi:hypothetical protein